MDLFSVFVEWLYLLIARRTEVNPDTMDNP